MKRMPFDLRDINIRNEYINNHKKWFLKNHENNISEFEKEIDKIYGKITQPSDLSLFGT